MLFDYTKFTAEDKEAKLNRAFSFAKYLVEHTNVITLIGLNKINQIELLENLIDIHKRYEKYEICEKLQRIKKDLEPML